MKTSRENSMNKILSSPVIKIATLIFGYFAALSSGRRLSSSFDYYMMINTGNWLRFSSPLPGAWRMISSYLPFYLFVLCVFVFILSIWKSNQKPKKGGRLSEWRRIDWTLLVALVYCFIVYCWNLVWNNPHSIFSPMMPTSYQLMILMAIVYLVVMGALSDIMARARDGELLKTLYWIPFFRLYPVAGLPGAIMAILLAINLVLVAVWPYISLWWLLSRPFLVLSAFTLAALTYFCKFVLSLSARYDMANAEKVRAERFRAELITNVSHDIRTPLTAIISYVDLLKAMPGDSPEFAEYAKFAEYVEVLDKKSARLKTLIDDLMEASKAGTGNISVDLREIDLAEIVGQAAGDFEEQFSERGLTLVDRQPDCAVMARADSRHLWRTLENLFGNAAKYALPGTRVFAEIDLRDDRPVFLLRNTSQDPIDMPAGELTEQFIRGDRSRQSEGNGLGLYIAKSLVELMGGHFTIRATGDLFEVEICLAGNEP